MPVSSERDKGEYGAHMVPKDITFDIIMRVITCDNCSGEFAIVINSQQRNYYPMKLVPHFKQK